MGKLVTVDFEDPAYYMCKNCRTHIALPLNPDYTPSPGRIAALFLTVINVQVNNQRRQLFGNLSDVHTVSDVNCIKCGDNLGFKYIETSSEERVLSNDFVQLEMRKLLWRKGDEIRDAETLIIVQ